MSTPETDTDPTTISEYSPTVAALAVLRQRHEHVVYAVETRAGMASAIEARRELRETRVELEKTRKRIKAPALAYCQAIDEQARKITAQIVALEDPIDAQIKAEEARRAAEKTARETADREAREAEARAKAEAEQAAERERLAAERAEQERVAKAERERLAAIEAEQQAERDRLAAERARLEREQAEARAATEAAQRASREAAEREATEIRRKAEADAAAERAKIEAERECVASVRRERVAALREQARVIDAEREAVVIPELVTASEEIGVLQDAQAELDRAKRQPWREVERIANSSVRDAGLQIEADRLCVLAREHGGDTAAIEARVIEMRAVVAEAQRMQAENQAARLAAQSRRDDLSRRAQSIRAEADTLEAGQ